MGADQGKEVQRQSEYVYLHILRAFACLWVIAVHWEACVPLPGALHRICAAGSSGVTIFFVLSGFLAFPSLQNEQVKHEKWGSLHWLGKRAVRLLPLYYCVILFYFIYYTAVGGVPADETGIGWFRYVFLVNQCVPSGEVFWTNIGAVWTISIFMMCYLFTPLYHKAVRSYYAALLGVAVTYVFARVIGHYTDWLRPLQYFYYFAIGVMAHMAVKERRGPQMTGLLSAGLLLLLVMESQGGLRLGLLTAIFIVATCELTLKEGIIRNLIVALSRCSYSVYLVHVAVITVLDKYRPDSDIVFTLIFLIVTAAFSFGAYQLIEKRLGRLLLLKKKQN